ncbi:hypothetical protein SDC9_194085 [bioreactor metagenome]|uniref:Uncharacterized protein n=1 Tax=bioreactor metagenome TaxID=1076179 RepID=A0A645I7X7_9ZZZZ
MIFLGLNRLRLQFFLHLRLRGTYGCFISDILQEPFLIFAVCNIPYLRSRSVAEKHLVKVDVFACQRGTDTDTSVVCLLQGEHLALAGSLCPLMEPGAVCGPAHAQIYDLAGEAVPYPIDLVSRDNERPLLPFRSGVIPELDGRAVFGVIVGNLEHFAVAGGYRVKTILAY